MLDMKTKILYVVGWSCKQLFVSEVRNITAPLLGNK